MAASLSEPLSGFVRATARLGTSNTRATANARRLPGDRPRGAAVGQGDRRDPRDDRLEPAQAGRRASAGARAGKPVRRLAHRHPRGRPGARRQGPARGARAAAACASSPSTRRRSRESMRHFVHGQHDGLRQGRRGAAGARGGRRRARRRARHRRGHRARWTTPSSRSRTSAHDLETSVQIDLEFHRAIATATHNELFLVLHDSIGQMLVEVRRRNLSRGPRRAPAGGRACTAASATASPHTTPTAAQRGDARPPRPRPGDLDGRDDSLLSRSAAPKLVGLLVGHHLEQRRPAVGALAMHRSRAGAQLRRRRARARRGRRALAPTAA